MAQFIGTVKGSRGEASRLGGKASGLTVKANGWRIGITVHLTHNEETGKDEVAVYKTAGPSGSSAIELIASFSE